jgi:hypothetical protein
MHIRQKIHICLSRPAMCDAHYSFHHLITNSRFHFDLSPIRFDDYEISILNPIFFCRLLMNLCKGFWTPLLKTFDVSMLGMSIVKDSSARCENKRVLLKQLGVPQRTLIWFSIGRERIEASFYPLQPKHSSRNCGSRWYSL